jgi:uncharacterized protein (TIGR03435 family)
MNAEQRQALLRSLLKMRFHLTVTEETQERDAFLLQTARSGSRLGAPVEESNAEKLKLGLFRQSRPGLMVVERLSMEGLARSLKEPAGRIVFDRTGLAGRYNFALHWTPEGAEPTEWPDLSIALEEQLGLRLVAAKVPLAVIVINHAEEPSEN